MKFHREGRVIMSIAFVLFIAINITVYFTAPAVFLAVSIPVTAIMLMLVVQFFRVPKRVITVEDGLVVCPADGKVVVIEETDEPEYLKDRRIQVSIFMSPLNVHINWYPISGIVRYYKYHKGKYLVAWHPKSSTDNERTTVVVESPGGVPVLFRQIAGAVARRIICYSKPGLEVSQSTEFGFIKFGSRVDVFLPLGSEVRVKINDMVKGSQTVLAALPKVAK